MDSYDVRFWDIEKLGNGSGARFRVRWAADGREHCKSFKGRPLAGGFLACVLARAIRHPASGATCRRGSAGRLTHDTAGPEKAPTDQTEMCASLVVLPGQNDD